MNWQCAPSPLSNEHLRNSVTFCTLLEMNKIQSADTQSVNIYFLLSVF